MNNYLHNQYLETKAKFEKFSSRLERSQDRGDFFKLTKGKQNYLIKRVHKLWEKLRLLEVRLKITTSGAALALMLMVSNVNAQQFVEAPEKNPLPPPTVFGFNPTFVDIDMDGDLDIIADDYENAMMFLNVGTAGNPDFEAVPTEDDPFTALNDTEFDSWDIIGAADLDGDNDIDILTDDGYLYRNTGSNSDIIFTEEDLMGDLPYDAALGDFDGDGDLDLMAPAYGKFIYFYENLGSASNFDLKTNDPVSFEIANWNESISDLDEIVAVDLDNDGDIDLAVSYDFYDSNEDWQEGVTLIENVGSSSLASFSLAPESSNPFSSLQMDDFTLGDLDDDGDYDLIYTDYYAGGGIQLLEMTANGLVPNTELVPEFSDGIVLPLSYYFSPQFVDYDGDGDLDFFAWNYYGDNGGTIYYENTGSSTEADFVLREDASFDFVDPGLYAQVPFFTDLDMDGDIDVVRLSYDYETESTEYYLLENTGSDANPVYSEKLISELSREDDDWIVPVFVDIDDDGDMDIFHMYYDYISEGVYDLQTSFLELTSLSPLTFTERTGGENPLGFVDEESFDELAEGAKPVFSDLDDDGDYDVVLAGYYGLYFLENTGSASDPAFVDATDTSPLPLFDYISEGSSLNLADIDGDGDDDLFMHEVYGMITSFYENTAQSSGGGGGTGLIEANIKTVNAYPNPVANELFLEIPDLERNVRYSVTSLDGRQIESKVLDHSKEGRLVIHTESYAPGYYLIRVESGTESYRATFVKQ